MTLAPAAAERSTSIVMAHNMKKYLNIIFITAFSFLIFSCGDFLGSVSDAGFWVLDYSKANITQYRIYADLLAGNDLCDVYAQKGSGVTVSQAQKVADEYKKNIYVKLMGTFGWEFEGYDVMQYADIYGNRDGKLTILLYDIMDGYKQRGDACVGGYYFPQDHFSDHSGGRRSNERDMIYLDTYPSVVGSEEFYENLAHEMQHMMNFISTIIFRSVVDENNQIKEIFLMDTWIDEGLSSAAEWVYTGRPSKDRVDWYNADRTGLISQGDNFFIWDNYRDNPLAVLNEYATVNIFFQWIRIQNSLHKNLKSNQIPQDIYYYILTSEYHDYYAVANQLNTNWDSLLEMWHSANFINDASSVYGYKNNDILKEIKAPYFDPAANASAVYSINNSKYIRLYPGEAVYSYTETNYDYTNSGKVWYANLVSGSKRAFLAYNIDTNYNGENAKITYQDGFITGMQPPKAQISALRSLSGGTISSYRIDAADLIRRSGTGFSANLLSGNKSNSPGTISGKKIIKYEALNE